MSKIIAYHNGKVLTEVDLDPSQEYIIGRDANADIQLEKAKGISRQHIRLFFSDENWYIEVLSQFGNVNFEGDPIDELLLDMDTIFKLDPYDFHFKYQDMDEDENQASQKSLPPIIRNSDSIEKSLISSNSNLLEVEIETPKHPIEQDEKFRKPEEIALDSFSDEDTSPGVQKNLVGIIKWRDEEGKKRGFKITGKSCVVGRGSGCDITIKHKSFSRRHFEIVRENNNFLLADLGSANGTKLNNKKVSKNQPELIESGDKVNISGFSLSFEVKDEEFSNKLSAVPALQQINHGGMPAPPHAAGARVVRVNNGNRVLMSDPDSNKKKIRYAIMGLIPVVLIGILFNTTAPKDQEGSKTLAVTELTFDKLTAEEKSLVIDAFKLGKNHFSLGKYANCASEFEKLHKILPFYQNSKEVAELCKQALDSEIIVNEREAKRRKQILMEQRIGAIVEDCRARIKRFATTAQAQACISEAITMFPDHPAILDYQNELMIRDQQEKDKAKSRAQRAAKIRKGENLYRAAKTEYKKQNFRRAIDKYKKFLDAFYPDPNKLRPKAKREIASAKQKLSSNVKTFFTECKQRFNDRNLKESILACDKALKEDPKNVEVVNFRKTAASELNKEMKTIYQDAILEEALGNVAAAKEKWKKILELDISSGNYYKKSKSKLKKYGIGI